MKNTVFVVSKHPVTLTHIPSEVKGWVPIIREYEVIKRTTKGYRLRVGYGNDSMYLNKHYEIFHDYKSALKFIESEASKVLGELDQLKLKATRIKQEAIDELAASHSGE